MAGEKTEKKDAPSAESTKKMIPRIILKSKEEFEVKQGFPWVYNNEIEFVRFSIPNGSKSVPYFDAESMVVPDGSVVEVFSHSGDFLGTGVLNHRSVIAVRIIGRGRAEQILSDTNGYFLAKIQAAYDLRKLFYSAKDSYRLVYGESDLLPGLIVERYVDVHKNVYIVVQFSTLSCEVFRREILAALRAVCRPWGIYEKSDAPTREKDGLPLKSCWHGEVRDEKIVIRENDILIEVDLTNGQKTGYFLDQKDNRKLVSTLCAGKRVLDTFAHTGAFALNALRAGAKEAIAVDISEDAVSLIKKNGELNYAGEKLKTVCADVFELLKEYEQKGEKFDVIILDPPAFTKSVKNIQKAYGGYKEINMRAMRLLAPGGILATCSCSYFFDAEHFYGMLMKAASDAKRRVQILSKTGAGPDHPVLAGYPKSDYLKCALCRVL